MTRPHWLPRDVIAPVTTEERAAVRHAQRVLRCSPSGEMDNDTIAALRGLQRMFGLPPSGVLDAATGNQIDKLRTWHEEESSDVRT